MAGAPCWFKTFAAAALAKIRKKKKLPLGGPNRNPRTLEVGRYLKVGGL